jgi:alkyl sulfatase BDS1-like metallo-beta-lactamase superfamily hydrolase
LPFDDQTDFENARRGFIADSPNRVITNPDGSPSFDLDVYGFVRGASAPDTVSPSLWRQSQLLVITGLFEVAEGIDQVRNFDLAVVAFILGATGWFVVDPLVTAAPAAEGVRLGCKHVADLSVVAVLSTHSYADHFGGIEGVADKADVAAGRVRYVVPVGAGLGPSASSGSMSLFPPTDLVDHTGQGLEIDGVRFAFQYTPGADRSSQNRLLHAKSTVITGRFCDVQSILQG